MVLVSSVMCHQLDVPRKQETKPKQCCTTVPTHLLSLCCGIGLTCAEPNQDLGAFATGCARSEALQLLRSTTDTDIWNLENVVASCSPEGDEAERDHLWG